MKWRMNKNNQSVITHVAQFEVKPKTKKWLAMNKKRLPNKNNTK
jgi:hypothetical protein